MRHFILMFAIPAVALAGCGGSDSSQGETAPAPREAAPAPEPVAGVPAPSRPSSAEPPAALPEALARAVHDLGNVDWMVAREAARELGRLNDPRAVPALIAVLKGNPEGPVAESARALGEIGDRRAVEPLIEVLGEDEDTIEITDRSVTDPMRGDLGPRIRAAEALGKLGDLRAAKPLAETLSDAHPDIRKASASALRALTKQDFGEDRARWEAWLEREGKRETGK